MREEYTGREVAVAAARPLLDYLRQRPENKEVLSRIDPIDSRLSWDTTCELLERLQAQAPDVAAIGAEGLASTLYQYRKRVQLARHVLTLEDTLRFILYPRNPIDFACMNVAVTAVPGRVDVVSYILHQYRPNKVFFELMFGAAQELVRLLNLPDASVSMNVSGRQAHFVFTHAVSNGVIERVRRIVSGKVHAAYALMVIRSSYPDLVRGRKLFEEQLIERAEIEAQLAASERAFARRMREMDDVIAEFDARGRLVYVSPNLHRLIGVPVETVQAEPTRVVHAEDLGRVQQGMARALREPASHRIEDFRVVNANGSIRWVEVTINRSVEPGGDEHIFAVAHDVTERRAHDEERQRLDRQLEHTQRLEVLGVLTGGIAHDFNNLLMPILGQAELASMELEDRPELRARVDTIRAAAEKAADLVRQLMVYAGSEPASFAVVDLGKETRELLGLAKTSILPNVDLRVSLDETAYVRGDASQLRQVIMNLIINAAEAIGDRPGLIELDVRSEDGSIVLSVRDDGCGMDEVTRERAFDPFFTTKFTGRGLGLSAVMGIVRVHNGDLLLDTRLGTGTRVELTLAAVGDGASDVAEPIAIHADGSGTVLLVDDEEAVRQVGKSMLEAVGYDVMLASDGEEALAKIDAADLKALVVDLVMPKVDGREVLSAVRMRFPRLPFIMVSGYGAQLVNVGSADPYTRFLTKPYRMKELSATLRELTHEADFIDA